MNHDDPRDIPEWFEKKFEAENPGDGHRLEEAWKSGNAEYTRANPHEFPFEMYEGDKQRLRAAGWVFPGDPTYVERPQLKKGVEMTVRDLIHFLRGLPVKALDMDILVAEGDHAQNIQVVPITESNSDSTIIGYMIEPVFPSESIDERVKRPVHQQMRLNFDLPSGEK